MPTPESPMGDMPLVKQFILSKTTISLRVVPTCRRCGILSKAPAVKTSAQIPRGIWTIQGDR